MSSIINFSLHKIYLTSFKSKLLVYSYILQNGYTSSYRYISRHRRYCKQRGTKKQKLAYKIQSATMKDSDEIKDLIRTVYLPNDPVIKSYKFDEKANEQVLKIVLSTLCEDVTNGLTLVAKNLVPKLSPQIYGVALCGIITPENNFAKGKKAIVDNPRVRHLLRLWHHVAEKACLFTQFNVNEIFEISVVTTRPMAQGQGIGTELIKEAINLGKKKGLKLVRVDASSFFTSLMCMKLGMREVYKVYFNEYIDQSTNLMLSQVEHPHKHFITYALELKPDEKHLPSSNFVDNKCALQPQLVLSNKNVPQDSKPFYDTARNEDPLCQQIPRNNCETSTPNIGKNSKIHEFLHIPICIHSCPTCSASKNVDRNAEKSNEISHTTLSENIEQKSNSVQYESVQCEKNSQKHTEQESLPIAQIHTDICCKHAQQQKECSRRSSSNSAEKENSSIQQTKLSEESICTRNSNSCVHSTLPKKPSSNTVGRESHPASLLTSSTTDSSTYSKPPCQCESKTPSNSVGKENVPVPSTPHSCGCRCMQSAKSVKKDNRSVPLVNFSGRCSPPLVNFSGRESPTCDNSKQPYVCCKHAKQEDYPVPLCTANIPESVNSSYQDSAQQDLKPVKESMYKSSVLKESSSNQNIGNDSIKIYVIGNGKKNQASKTTKKIWWLECEKIAPSIDSIKKQIMKIEENKHVSSIIEKLSQEIESLISHFLLESLSTTAVKGTLNDEVTQNTIYFPSYYSKDSENVENLIDNFYSSNRNVIQKLIAIPRKTYDDGTSSVYRVTTFNVRQDKDGRIENISLCPEHYTFINTENAANSTLKTTSPEKFIILLEKIIRQKRIHDTKSRIRNIDKVSDASQEKLVKKSEAENVEHTKLINPEQFKNQLSKKVGTNSVTKHIETDIPQKYLVFTMGTKKNYEKDIDKSDVSQKSLVGASAAKNIEKKDKQIKLNYYQQKNPNQKHIDEASDTKSIDDSKHLFHKSGAKNFDKKDLHKKIVTEDHLPPDWNEQEVFNEVLSEIESQIESQDSKNLNQHKKVENMDLKNRAEKNGQHDLKSKNLSKYNASENVLDSRGSHETKDVSGVEESTCSHKTKHIMSLRPYQVKNHKHDDLSKHNASHNILDSTDNHKVNDSNLEQFQKNDSIVAKSDRSQVKSDNDFKSKHNATPNVGMGSTGDYKTKHIEKLETSPVIDDPNKSKDQSKHNAIQNVSEPTITQTIKPLTSLEQHEGGVSEQYDLKSKKQSKQNAKQNKLETVESHKSEHDSYLKQSNVKKIEQHIKLKYKPKYNLNLILTDSPRTPIEYMEPTSNNYNNNETSNEQPKHNETHNVLESASSDKSKSLLIKPVENLETSRVKDEQHDFKSKELLKQKVLHNILGITGLTRHHTNTIAKLELSPAIYDQNNYNKNKIKSNEQSIHNVLESTSSDKTKPVENLEPSRVKDEHDLKSKEKSIQNLKQNILEVSGSNHIKSNVKQEQSQYDQYKPKDSSKQNIVHNILESDIRRKIENNANVKTSQVKKDRDFRSKDDPNSKARQYSLHSTNSHKTKDVTNLDQSKVNYDEQEFKRMKQCSCKNLTEHNHKCNNVNVARPSIKATNSAISSTDVKNQSEKTYVTKIDIWTHTSTSNKVSKADKSDTNQSKIANEHDWDSKGTNSKTDDDQNNWDLINQDIKSVSKNDSLKGSNEISEWNEKQLNTSRNLHNNQSKMNNGQNNSHVSRQNDVKLDSLRATKKDIKRKEAHLKSSRYSSTIRDKVHTHNKIREVSPHNNNRDVSPQNNGREMNTNIMDSNSNETKKINRDGSTLNITKETRVKVSVSHQKNPETQYETVENKSNFDLSKQKEKIDKTDQVKAKPLSSVVYTKVNRKYVKSSPVNKSKTGVSSATLGTSIYTAKEPATNVKQQNDKLEKNKYKNWKDSSLNALKHTRSKKGMKNCEISQSEKAKIDTAPESSMKTNVVAKKVYQLEKQKHKSTNDVISTSDVRSKFESLRDSKPLKQISPSKDYLDSILSSLNHTAKRVLDSNSPKIIDDSNPLSLTEAAKRVLNSKSHNVINDANPSNQTEAANNILDPDYRKTNIGSEPRSLTETVEAAKRIADSSNNPSNAAKTKRTQPDFTETLGNAPLMAKSEHKKYDTLRDSIVKSNVSTDNIYEPKYCRGIESFSLGSTQTKYAANLNWVKVPRPSEDSKPSIALRDRKSNQKNWYKYTSNKSLKTAPDNKDILKVAPNNRKQKKYLQDTGADNNLHINEELNISLIKNRRPSDNNTPTESNMSKSNTNVIDQGKSQPKHTKLGRTRSETKIFQKVNINQYDHLDFTDMEPKVAHLVDVIMKSIQDLNNITASQIKVPSTYNKVIKTQWIDESDAEIKSNVDDTVKLNLEDLFNLKRKEKCIVENIIPLPAEVVIRFAPEVDSKKDSDTDED